MKKYLGHFGAFYLGTSLNLFAVLGAGDWQFWAIVVPTLILLTADKKLNK